MEFVSWQSYGFTHINAALHFPSAAKLSTEEFLAINDFTDACVRLNKVAIHYSLDSGGVFLRRSSDGIDG
jgi:hypothetical protein